ncbi:FAD-dependent monooxygenase [Amycolatopsis sp. NPDC006131]|uniref:FAD-dependent oxidoreductase n=1 Tax=Amycolatopsis sp. NPDC006131 TaxID=3156731 RepID=UPI0033A9D3EC
MAVNGIAALGALDLQAVVRDKGFATTKMSIGMGGKKPMAEFGFGAALPDGTGTHTIRRADLYDSLRDEAVRRGVPTEYGKRLVAAAPEAGGVTATFADGSTAHADLLIGADGLRSTVRTIIDPGAPPPRYVPLLNTGATPGGCGSTSSPARCTWCSDAAASTPTSSTPTATCGGSRTRASLGSRHAKN